MISTPEKPQGIGGLWDRFTAPTERIRRPFRRWRRGRPFSAGLSILLAGLEIYWAPHSGLGMMLSMGLPGISTIFISVFLVIFAVTVWFYPAYRVFAGIAAIMLALLSLVATNLGGFFLGFLLGMLGGAFAVAWAPRTDYTADTRRQRKKNGVVAGDGDATTAAEGTEGAETAQTAEVPAQGQAPEGEPTEEAEAEPSVEYTENTQIIEQAIRSDEDAPVSAEHTAEEE